MLRIRLKTTTAIYCPFCKSPFVSHGEPKVTRSYFRHEEYVIKCEKCGAEGFIRESWEIPKNKEGL